MDNIFITLRISNREDLDLKIPGFVTGKEFLKMMVEITGEKIYLDSKIHAEPLGRILDDSQTLYSEGVGQGALLTLLF